MRALTLFVLLFLLSFAVPTRAQTTSGEIDAREWFEKYLDSQRGSERHVLIELGPNDIRHNSQLFGIDELQIGIDTYPQIDMNFFGPGQTLITEVIEVATTATEEQPSIRRLADVSKALEGGRWTKIATFVTEDPMLEEITRLQVHLPPNRLRANFGLKDLINRHTARGYRLGSNVLTRPDLVPHGEIFSPRAYRPLVDSDITPTTELPENLVTVTSLIIERIYDESGRLRRVESNLVRSNAHLNDLVTGADVSFFTPRKFIGPVVLTPGFSTRRSDPCHIVARELARRESVRLR